MGKLIQTARIYHAIYQLIEFALLSSAVALTAFAAGAMAARLIVTRWFEFPFSPDWVTLALVPLGAIFLAVLAAFLAALPALNVRPAQGLRAL